MNRHSFQDTMFPDLPYIILSDRQALVVKRDTERPGALHFSPLEGNCCAPKIIYLPVSPALR